MVGAADGTRTAARAKLVVYKFIEVVGDRVVPKYSSEKPKSGTFEIVQR